MSNKKLFAIILSAIVLTSVVSVGAYKIFTKNVTQPSVTTTAPNFESIVDSIDYSENLLDSNAVYKEKFSEDLKSQGRWIPIKSTDLIKQLTTPQPDEVVPQVQNVGNENNVNENTSVAKNIAPASDDTFDEEVPTTNLTTSNRNADVREVSETKTVTETKIVYIWQPNECSGSSWNPYSNGRWEFTCAGWVWNSDYSWGRRCYNYGRWVWTSYYGWVWMPGGRWAPNWVTWRQCGNYNGGCYIGWYPTCPILYWQNHHNLVVCNSHFTSNPVHWTVVNQNDFTKKITKITRVDPVKNAVILNNSEKIKVIHTVVADDGNIKYNGPNVKTISDVTKTNIIPTKIDIPITKTVKNTEPVKQVVVNDPYIKIKNTKVNDETEPVFSTINITKTTDPTIKSGVQPVKTTEPVKNEITPIKVADPSINTTKQNPSVKIDPPAKTTTKTNNTTRTETTSPDTKKNDTPKNDPPVKTPAPKYDPPPVKTPTPKYDPPPVKTPSPRNDPPVKQEPPKQDPPVKNNPPVKQDPPKQDPPPQKKDDTKND